MAKTISAMDSNTLEPFSYGFDKTLQDPKQFFRYGVFIKKIFDEDQISTLKNKVCKIVEGKYETGMQPDKIKYLNWADGLIVFVMDGSLMCGLENFFKKQAFQDMFLFTSWKTVKLNQDTMFSVLPDSDNATSFHQDNAYQNWHTSTGGVVTAWIALSETRANSGGIEYLLGSHQMN